MQFGRLYLSRSEGSRDSNLGLRDYVRNSKKRLLIAAHTIEKDEDRKTQMNTKRGKRMKGKHSEHKNNCMDNLSGK